MKEKSQPKKSYRPPRLISYGTLATLTKAKGGGSGDGGGKPKTKVPATSGG